MPELPEVETVMRAIAPTLVGCTIRRVECLTPSLREPLDASALNRVAAGRKVKGLSRRGKWIVADLPARRYLLIHLGMTGQFHMEAAGTAPEAHDRVILHLSKKESLHFRDTRKFGTFLSGVMGPGEVWPQELAGLGPEPLTDAFTSAYVYAFTRNRRGPIKPLLMNAVFVVGVGNIYASEACYRAGISPRRKAGSLGQGRCERLVTCIKNVLAEAIEKGGTTIRDYTRPDGSEGWFRLSLDVYGREGEACHHCGTTIRRIVQAGRSTFYCPTCQR